MDTSKELRQVSVGDGVIYRDAKGNDHQALVTTVFNGGHSWEEYVRLFKTSPMVNLIFASSDESRTDWYGRQIERERERERDQCSVRRQAGP
jgi:hypothetical protein